MMLNIFTITILVSLVQFAASGKSTVCVCVCVRAWHSLMTSTLCFRNIAIATCLASCQQQVL